MSHSSDLHLLLSDYERMFGEMEEEERRAFALKYSKGLLPHQKKERFPADDEQPEHRPRRDGKKPYPKHEYGEGCYDPSEGMF